MAFDPSKYTVAKARPLPVILLLDRSGSMCGEKISTLNSAVNEMIQSFNRAEHTPQHAGSVLDAFFPA